jgi:hypothetical protein
MTTDRVSETVGSLPVIEDPKTFEDDDENEYDCAARKHD